MQSPQISLPFEPGLVELWPTAREYLLYQIQLKKIPQKGLAAEMDISPSVLSRKLNQGEGDCQRLTFDDVEKIFKVGGPALVRDMMVYFVTKYCDSQEAQKERERAEMVDLSRRLNQVLAKWEKE